jgi:hypothetical protein
MLGYVNRYVSKAVLIRSINKDYETGAYRHVHIVRQLKFLAKRIELSRYMLEVAGLAFMFACLSMFLIFANLSILGSIAFGLSLISVVASLFISLYETWLSNRSLSLEIQHVLEQEKAQSK